MDDATIGLNLVVWCALCVAMTGCARQARVAKPKMVIEAAHETVGAPKPKGDFRQRSDMRAMWLWNETPRAREVLKNVRGAQDALFEFMRAPHGQKARSINRLYFAARAHANVDTSATLQPVIYDPLLDDGDRGDLRAFLRRAHEAGVAVEYLDGQAIWLASDKNARAGAQVCRDVVAFNLSSRVAGERLDGVHLDIEPNTVVRGPWAGQWWKHRLPHGYNARWTTRWKRILTTCREAFDAYEAATGQHLTLACDVGPDFAHYDKPMRAFLDGAQRPVDYVGVLNYYDNRENRDGEPSFFAGAYDGNAIVGGVDENLRLWKHVPVVFGLETGPTAIAPDRRSFHQEGYRAMYRVIDQLHARCHAPGCLGVAIHHYGPDAYRALKP